MPMRITLIDTTSAMALPVDILCVFELLLGLFVPGYAPPAIVPGGIARGRDILTDRRDEYEEENSRVFLCVCIIVIMETLV